ncbi:MAG: [protein-PII] uridylyltransferase [Pseudomonadota bacterium]
MSVASAPLPEAMFNPAELNAALQTTGAIEACKASIARATEYQHQRFRAGVQAKTLIRERAQLIDAILCTLWDRQNWESFPVSLIAVGGYGRGELHPHSDIDILILLGNGAEHPAGLSEFLTLLWDIGLDIAHSVRSISECVAQAREDITVLTNLLETRILRGSGEFLAEVKNRTATEYMWSSKEFFQAKLHEQNERHHKFADTEYNLEPNLKSSPGGLRDVQVIGWIAERHFGLPSLQDIRDEDSLNRDEMEILLNGRDFMWQVRYALHMIAGREEDRLLFDHQRELAALWGLQDGDKLAVEQFMQVYYRWALALGQLNEVFMQNFDQTILRGDLGDDIREVDADFQVRNGYIEACRQEVFSANPRALLTVFLHCANDDSIEGVAAPTIRLIRDTVGSIDDSFRNDDVNRRTFVEILSSPYKMTLQLRRMSRYGVLGAYLPEFGRIIGQMQHDLFHVYTVDAHTLEVVKFARRFSTAGFEDKFPVSSRVARRLRREVLLYIAALYHDIGKGRGGDHSELGAVDAEAFCESHFLDARDSELVVWLVRNHLLMSAISQRKDISDPAVIQQFAKHVGDVEHLDYLFTLTVADINATNPTLWNAWRGSLLRKLYTETRRALRRGLDNPINKQELVARARQSAETILEGRGFTEEELEVLWADRGDDYFMRERAGDIAWHTESIANHHDRDTPLVLVRNDADSSVANTTQIFIHARSDPQLFARICAALEQLDLSVHDARIYNSQGGMSLDTFFVLDYKGQPIPEGSERLQQISEKLNRILKTKQTEPQIVTRRTPRQVKSFSIPTETSMFVDPIKNLSVLEVTTPDRPGLLARLGRIFSDYDVELQAAKIQTLGERVEDVFFITNSSQQAITDPELCEAIQQTIRDELDEQAAA